MYSALLIAFAALRAGGRHTQLHRYNHGGSAQKKYNHVARVCKYPAKLNWLASLTCRQNTMPGQMALLMAGQAEERIYGCSAHDRRSVSDLKELRAPGND